MNLPCKYAWCYTLCTEALILTLEHHCKYDVYCTSLSLLRRNCLFHALSDQLCDGHSSHVGVRRSVVKYMREHCEDFSPFVEDNVSFENHGERGLCQHCERFLHPIQKKKSPNSHVFLVNNSVELFDISVSELAKDGVYAGNDSIVAFARCYGVSVVIHQLNAPRWEVHAPVPIRGRTLHIAYLNEEHYCSVQPLLPDHPLPPLVGYSSR